MPEYEYIDTVVIGGGQAGLAVGRELQKRNREFVILDAHPRVGDAWRTRWDSLVMFTTARYCGLPGMRFPKRASSCPTKDEMADYLEAYAGRFNLPVRTNTRVAHLGRKGDGFTITTTDGATIDASNVVVAMSNHQQPHPPVFASKLDSRIVQMHSFEYKNLSQLVPGPVLIVGVGNSGADIAIEVAREHSTVLAGKESGHIPPRIEGFIARNVVVRLVRFVFHHVFTVRTPIGRKVRPHFQEEAAPLIRVKPKDFDRAGIRRVGRIVDVRGGLPVSETGEALDVANVIWCTGLRPGFSWIDLPVLGPRQEPQHERGVVDSEPGLYFVGLEFLYALSSATIIGVARDAKRAVKHLCSHRPAAKMTERVAAAS
jgi:putative flavoprotein involved in K+ transport